MFIAQPSLREVKIPHKTSLLRHLFLCSLKVAAGLFLQLCFYERSSYLNFLQGNHVPTVSITSVSRLRQVVQENLRLKAHICSWMLHTLPAAAILGC